jgi:hypothetical protein
MDAAEVQLLIDMVENRPETARLAMTRRAAAFIFADPAGGNCRLARIERLGEGRWSLRKPDMRRGWFAPSAEADMPTIFGKLIEAVGKSSARPVHSQ